MNGDNANECILIKKYVVKLFNDYFLNKIYFLYGQLIY